MNLQTKSATGFFDGPVVALDFVGAEEAAQMIADRRAVWTHQEPSPVEPPMVEPKDQSGDR